MTTDIRIRVNGNYIAEGGVTLVRKSPNLGEGSTTETRAIKVSGVGQSQPVEESINIPHGTDVTLQLSERQATEDEVNAAAQKTAEGGAKSSDDAGE